MADVDLQGNSDGTSAGAGGVSEINPQLILLVDAAPAPAAAFPGTRSFPALGQAARLPDDGRQLANTFLATNVRSRTYGEGNYGDANYGVEDFDIELGDAVLEPQPAMPTDAFTAHPRSNPLGTARHIAGCTTFTPPSTSSYAVSHGSSDASGTLTVLLGLQGSSGTTSTASATLGLLVDLAGSSHGVSTGQGNLGRLVPIAGATQPAVAAASATLSVHSPTLQPLAGSSAGHSHASATLSITLGPRPYNPPYIRTSSVRTTGRTPAGVRFHQQRRKVS